VTKRIASNPPACFLRVSLHAEAALRTERWNEPHWDIPNLYVVNVGLGNELNTSTCQVGPQSVNGQNGIAGRRWKIGIAAGPVILLLASLGAILPVDPVYRMRRKVGIHRFAESRKEGLFAKAREESEAPQLVLDRILHLCKA
jgi:hypothetical protein